MYTIKWAGLEPNEAGWSPPSDTNPKYMGSSCGHVDRSVGSVGQFDADLVVDDAFVDRVGVGQDCHDVSELGNHCFDLVGGESPLGRFASQFAFQLLALSFYFGDPSGGDCEVAVVFEEGPVLGEFGVAVLEPTAQVEDSGLVVVGGGGLVGGGQASGGVLDVFTVEEVTDPGVESRDDGILTDIDGFGVLCFAGGVLGWEFAPVVGLAVVP